MARSDWIAIAVTLICILFSDVFGGHKAAIICGIVGLTILIILHARGVKTSEQTPQKQAEDITPEDLLTIFDGRTEVQAQLYVRRWLGKRVRLSGPLSNVSLSGLSIYVSLAGASGLDNCYFFAPRTQLDEGTVESVDAVAIQLRKVRLVKVEDQPV